MKKSPSKVGYFRKIVETFRTAKNGPFCPDSGKLTCVAFSMFPIVLGTNLWLLHIIFLPKPRRAIGPLLFFFPRPCRESDSQVIPFRRLSRFNNLITIWQEFSSLKKTGENVRVCLYSQISPRNQLFNMGFMQNQPSQHSKFLFIQKWITNLILAFIYKNLC